MLENFSHYTGDIWDLKESHAIVIPVNLQGVMGRGIARQCKDRHPEQFYEMAQWCVHMRQSDSDNLVLFAADTDLLILFPVKHDWKDKADLMLIDKSLKQLRSLILKRDKFHNKFVRVALPEVGCGFGNLKWEYIENTVKGMLEDVGRYITLVHPTKALLNTYPDAFQAGVKRDPLTESAS